MSEAGKPLSESERATRSNKQLIQNINRSIRTDFGGAPNVLEHIVNMFTKVISEEGRVGWFKDTPPVPFVSWVDIVKILAPITLDVVKHQVEGIRKRTSHDREELLRRFSEEFATTIPSSDNELSSAVVAPIAESQIDALRKDFDQKLYEVRVSHLMSLRQLNKIQKILAWSENQNWFNTDFIENLNESLLSRGTLTPKQEVALDNVIAKCVNGNGRPDYMDEDWSTIHGY